ncbi:Leucine aminopeptidase 1 [Dinochytrium kinnereticum]|nr:Leucine aminopeptidase 1 [Dinochytrium kinnereticum]
MLFTKLIAAVLSVAVSVSALRSNTPLSRREEGIEGVANLAPAARTIGPPAPIALPKVAAFQSVVNPLIAMISQPLMKAWAIRLTQFPERYYKSVNGAAAANWIRDQANALKPVDGTKLTVSLFQHSWRTQPSVIVRYESSIPTTLKGIVIAGTHFDTLGAGSGRPEPNKNPAADDCASGSTVIFEALRVLVTSGFVPGRPIEIHWYAAEEVGLLGSNEVAEAYAKAGTQVVSYLNLDQSGYVKAGTTPIMGVVTDYTSTASTAFLRSIVTTYTKYNFVNTKCGYKCTDHAAWTDHGYESGFAFESDMKNAFPYNDRVNRDGSPLDTVDKMDFNHIMEFIKSTLGYVVELSLTGKPQLQGGLFKRHGMDWRKVEA